MTPSINSIFWEFLKIGATVFGGPYPQAAVMEARLVRKHQWITPRQYQEGFALAQILPGPIGPQVAMFIGYFSRGRKGALAALLGFIAPAFLMVLGLSVLYQRLGLVPTLTRFFDGMKPAILLLLIMAGWQLAQTGWRSPTGRWVLLGSLGATLLRQDPLWILGLAAILGWSLNRPSASAGLGAWLLPVTLVSSPPKALLLFTAFFKAGALLYGGGWAIIPLLEHDVVHTYQWMTHQTFLDGTALGQMTPGPIAMTATFVGYHVMGFTGACLATFAIFFPSAVFVMAGTPWLLRWKDDPRVRPALDALVAAAGGLLLGEVIFLALPSFPHPWTWGIGAVSGLALWWKRWDPTLILIGSGLLGWLILP